NAGERMTAQNDVDSTEQLVRRQVGVESINAEIVNDRAKLLYHRLVAPRLRRDPSLVETARRVVERRRSSGERRDALDEWARLLSRPADEISIAIVQRSEQARRLRSSSPFPLVKE